MQILVVEDEAIIALYIGMTLQEAGHEVVGVASSLDDAVKLLDQKIPDLALIDINLGKDEDGVHIARTLSSSWGVSSIFVSAQDEKARRNMDAAIGWLKKPFATKSLVESVEVAQRVQQGVIPIRVPEGMDLFVRAA